MNPLSKIWLLIAAALFPPSCLNCGKHLPGAAEQVLCLFCSENIKINTSLFCPVCGLRLGNNKKICHKESQYLLAAAVNYNNDAVRKLLKFFKFKRWLRLKNPLGEILIDYLSTLNLELTNFVAVPVPLAPAREKKRGFNQAKILAEIAAKQQGLNLIDALKRIKNTQIQSLAKSREERERNVAGCFAVASPELIKGKNILLVDDVHTSGATIGEAARTLKAAGAKKIIALVVAKAR